MSTVEEKLIVGMKVRVIEGPHTGNKGVITLTEVEHDYTTKETRPVLIVRLDNSPKMFKLYPHQVSRALKLGKV